MTENTRKVLGLILIAMSGIGLVGLLYIYDPHFAIFVGLLLIGMLGSFIYQDLI